MLLDMERHATQYRPGVVKVRLLERYGDWPFDITHFMACNDHVAFNVEFVTADNIEQVLAHWAAYVDSDDRYVITVTEHAKADQPAHDGWRWRKWGEYIGGMTPKCEYLSDEPLIEKVMTASLFRIMTRKRYLKEYED